jgi:hypothetical protein
MVQLAVFERCTVRIFALLTRVVCSLVSPGVQRNKDKDKDKDVPTRSDTSPTGDMFCFTSEYVIRKVQEIAEGLERW